MTKPTQDKETLREAVARAVCPLVLATTEYYNEVPPEEVFSRPRYSFLKDACLFVADAAIATMFERLRTPSEGMIEASKPFRKGVGEAAGRLWQAMLDKFEQEDMARTTCTHEWEYTGTDHHGTHKGEAAYRCQKCKAFEYRT